MAAWQRILSCVVLVLASVFYFTPMGRTGSGTVNASNSHDGFALLNPSYPPEQEGAGKLPDKPQVSTPKLEKEEFIRKTQKLQMPFIANEGQTDAKVAFYANTFGGAVFVTKDGEIVYSLPSGRDVPGGASQALCRDTASRVPTSPIQYLASLTHSPKGDVLCRVSEKRESRIMDYVSWFGGCAPDGRKMGLHVSDSPRGLDTASHVPTTAARRDTERRVPGVALKEEFVGARVKTIQGEQPSVTKVNYFKGNDPSKWKTNVSTYDFVNLGEIYKGIELRLKAYGDNVEKLFYVKPGADPEQIKICLSGIQPLKNPPPLSPSLRGTGGCPPLAGAGGGAGAGGLSVNEDVTPTFMAGKRQGNGATPISPLEKGAGGLSA